MSVAGMTPRFTIKVWARVQTDLFPNLRLREAVAEIEVDQADLEFLQIIGHDGLELIPQKMLTAAPEKTES